jgi:hypothetical protein
MLTWGPLDDVQVPRILVHAEGVRPRRDEAEPVPYVTPRGAPVKRTLSLKRETLTELSPAELTAVVGAGLPSGLSCPLQTCFCVSNIGECVTWSCDVAG